MSAVAESMTAMRAASPAVTLSIPSSITGRGTGTPASAPPQPPLANGIKHEPVSAPPQSAEADHDKNTDDIALFPSVVRVIPAVKQYAWGMPATASAVAAFHARNGGLPGGAAGGGSLGGTTQEAVRADAPYAELWVGTHASTPCRIICAESKRDEPYTSLKSFIEDEVILVDPDKVSRYSELHAHGLPFLLKVLSIAKPLSIQAHPDKVLAAKLHRNAPDMYRDANHKPELAVALSPFEAMCGFRPAKDIAGDIARVPEFAGAVDRAVCDDFVRRVKSGSDSETALRKLFQSLMRQDEEAVKHAVEALSTRLLEMGPSSMTERDALFLHLNDHFPGDIGCFGAYLFSHIKLSPGEAVFIDANEPHAYIKGQCIEIMACSDNVVRAGLTPKKKDVETLVDMLSYADDPVQVSPGDRLDEYTTVYSPPVEEFILFKHEIPGGEKQTLQETTAPTILIVVSGSGYISVESPTQDPNTLLALAPGTVLYLKASTSHVVTASSALAFGNTDSDQSRLMFFRAGTNEAAIAPQSNCTLM